MHPRRFVDYEVAKVAFEKIGFRITPQPCRTQYKGQVFPRDYTKQQQQVIYGDQERPMLFDLPSYIGKLCRSGHNLVRIEPGGEIYRCPGHQGHLGDVRSGKLELYDQPRPCDREVCACNRFVRQVDMLPDQESMIDSFQTDITINESRIRRPNDSQNS
jgi:hypothetical protein